MIRMFGVALLALLSLRPLLAQPVPVIVVSPSEIDFGAVPVGETAEHFIMVFNAGTDVLIVDADIQGEAFALVGPLHFEVQPRDSGFFLVCRFTPADSIEYEGMVHFASNCPNAPDVYVPLTGRGGTDGGGEPGQFDLVSPPDGSHLPVSEPVVLVWMSLDVNDPVTYTVMMGNPDSSGFTYDAGSDTTYVIPVGELVPNTWYVWTVAASYGNAMQRAESVWEFIVGEPPPPPPDPEFSLISPPDGATIPSENQIFMWHALFADPAESVTYTLRIVSRDTVNGDFFDVSYFAGGDTTYSVQFNMQMDDAEYVWWVEATSPRWGMFYSEETWRFTLAIGSGTQPVEDGALRVTPYEFGIASVYPNPFNPATEIQIAVPSESFVRAEIYDLLGRSVTTLVNRRLEAGAHRFSWQAVGPAGTYILRVTNDQGRVDARKLVVIK